MTSDTTIAGGPAAGPPPRPDLSAEDLRILRLLADGWKNTEIGQRVYLPAGGVRERIDAIGERLGASGREHTAALGVAHRLVTAEHLADLPVVELEVRDSEKAILELMVIGATAAEIARRLQRSPHTVRDVVRRLRLDLCTRDGAKAAAVAVLLGLVSCRAVDAAFPDVPLPKFPVAGEDARVTQ